MQTMTTPNILINPRTMWGCPAEEQTRLHFVEGKGKDWPALPHEGDVLTLPFIQDPQSRQPIPVRVLQIQQRQDQAGHILVVVVARADQDH